MVSDGDANGVGRNNILQRNRVTSIIHSIEEG